MGPIFSLPALQQETSPVLGNEVFLEDQGLQQGSSRCEGTRVSGQLHPHCVGFFHALEHFSSIAN